MLVEERERLSFCQPVRQLICSRTICKGANSRLHLFTDIVPMHANVFGVFMCTRVKSSKDGDNMAGPDQPSGSLRSG